MRDPYVVLAPGDLDGRGVGDRVLVSAGVRHHLERVLRLRRGDVVEVTDGAGVVAHGSWDGTGVALELAPTMLDPARPQVTVWQAVGKGRKHDEVVRVLTELGVDEVVGVISDRTIVDLSGKEDRALERWTAVARASCEQARRAWLPRLAGPTPLGDALAGLDGRRCLVAQVGAATDPLGAASLEPAADVVVAVGPEGGWTDEEVAAFAAVGATHVGLGPTVLRTEHAAVVLAAIVMAATGRMSAA